MATTVTSKGQVTIPLPVRIGLRLKAGSKVEFVLDGERAIVEPVRGGVARRLAGSLRAYARRFRGATDRQVMAEIREEVADEAAREGRSDRHQRHPTVSPGR